MPLGNPLAPQANNAPPARQGAVPPIDNRDRSQDATPDQGITVHDDLIRDITENIDQIIADVRKKPGRAPKSPTSGKKEVPQLKEV